MSVNGVPPKPLQGQAGKQSLMPNQTLHIGNLPDKIHKDDMKKALYMMFSTHGHVLDIVVMRNNRMRGQAHIVFRDTNTSSQAMRALQGFEFSGRELRISYGKGKSNMISRLDGTAVMPESAKARAAPAPNEQKKVFAPLPGQAPPPGTIPAKPNLAVPNGPVDTPSPQGVKRPREESDEEDAPMDEDEGEAMDVSDED